MKTKKWTCHCQRGLVAFSLAVVLFLVMAAILAPWLTPYDPCAISLENKFDPPSPHHILGCDHLGRDVASRLLYGARTSLGSVCVILAGILILGFLAGTTAATAGGKIDGAIMRVCDIFLTFPTFILAMFLIGVLGTGLTNVILAVALTHWAWYARIIKSYVLTLKNREYILAARVSGSSRISVLFNHLLPPVLAQVSILATLDIGHMMMHVSGLSFLGLGVTPPTAEWGVMIADGRQYVWTHPEMIMYPGIAIFLTVMAFNLLGDALRDALDPQAEENVGAEDLVLSVETGEEKLQEVY